MTTNERIERLIATVDQALAENPSSAPPTSRFAATATLLEHADPEIAETFERLTGYALEQAIKRRISLDPDVQAARRWATDMGRAARTPR